jgi:hypothetical protein
MRYLDIARSVVTGDETNERNNNTPTQMSSVPSERADPEYERNECDEKSPSPAVDAADFGHDPVLRWVHVYQGPVEATVPPENWEGRAPIDCHFPQVCGPLGPCQSYADGSRLLKNSGVPAAN